MQTALEKSYLRVTEKKNLAPWKSVIHTYVHRLNGSPHLNRFVSFITLILRKIPPVFASLQSTHSYPQGLKRNDLQN